MTTLSMNTPKPERLLTTEQLADLLTMHPQSIRKRFSQTGSYFGLRPLKLPNGKLRWPSDSVEQLLLNAE